MGLTEFVVGIVAAYSGTDWNWAKIAVYMDCFEKNDLASKVQEESSTVAF